MNKGTHPTRSYGSCRDQPLHRSARNVIAASLKRLAHRNPNVQLYTLALVEALSKNCGIEVHREIASRAFTQGLEKLVTDRVHTYFLHVSLHLLLTTLVTLRQHTIKCASVC